MRLLQRTIDKIGRLNQDAMMRASARLDALTHPPGSLGRLEELAIQLAGIRGEPQPVFPHKAVIVMAGDHGVTEEGVSPYPQEVTAQMVLNFLAGGAGINVLARRADARVVVTDIGVARELPDHRDLRNRRIANGTRNMAREPAMSREEAVRSIETGIEVFQEELDKGLDLVATGEMGIGNTTASSAITAVITGKPVKEVTGRGTGVDDVGFQRKISVIEQAIRHNAVNASDPLEVLAKVGGYEIGGLAGVILGAAAARIPVLIDGFISGAAALIAAEIKPESKMFMIASHCSVERGHRIILDYLELKPLLQLDLRLGEGTGAAIAMKLVDDAVAIRDQMATFADAGVSNKD